MEADKLVSNHAQGSTLSHKWLTKSELGAGAGMEAWGLIYKRFALGLGNKTIIIPITIST